MNSQSKTDEKLTENEVIAIAIESRISGLTAAVYWLITALFIVVVAFVIVVFPNEAKAGIQQLDSSVNSGFRCLVYVPFATFLAAMYHLTIGNSHLRAELKRDR